MGYSTDLHGTFKLDRPLSVAHFAYLKKFNETRRMKRDEALVATLGDRWREAVGLPVGHEGAYFVGATGPYGQDFNRSVLDNNRPPSGQPGLWCKWAPTEFGDGIQWDGAEKFYNYVEWLQYLIEHFLGPWGYKLNGQVKWQGEDSDDYGLITVKDNVISIRKGLEIYADPKTGEVPADKAEIYRLLDLDEEALDEMVHDKKAEEAASINNAGNVAQIAYLTGVDEAKVLEILDSKGGF